MKVNPYIFRGYDLRGLVGEDLNEEIAEHLGKAHGTFLKRAGIGKALIGFDCRETSRSYADAFIRGLRWTGQDVIDIGMTMVGTFYWAQYHLKIEGGSFVTASHNPAEYNGFKFANGFSETLVSDGIQEVRRMVENEDYEKGETEGKLEAADVYSAYENDMHERLEIVKKFRVVVDASNATPGSVVPKLLRSFGQDVVESNCEIKPDFPLGTPDPTESKVAERLSRKVLEEKADFGFSYDADGDRIGIVDETGRIIWNDVLVALFAIDVLEKHPGATIMYNTLCSKVVEDTIKSHGGTPFMWRTGHSFLKKKNQTVGAAFIGELSGHFFFSQDFYNHDDGCYTTLRLLDYLSRTGKTLAQAIDELPKYISSPEIKLGAADEIKVELIKKISEVLGKYFPDAEVIDDERAGDGVRLNLSDSMLVIRYSQNGPYLTIKFEAQTQERYGELKKYLHDLLKSYPEIDWQSGVNTESI